MGSSSRHSAPASRALDRSYRRAISRSNVREEYYSTAPQASSLSPPRAPEHSAPDHTAGFWQPLESSVVHQLLREPPLLGRPEWGQSRAVADQRHSPPVGEPVAPPPLMALLREGRVPNKRRRS